MKDHGEPDGVVPAGQRPWPGSSIELPSGTRLFVRHAAPARAGAPYAVFVHGLGGSSLNWTGLMAELDGTFQQWAPDWPGFGESPPSRRHTIDAYVDVLMEYLEELGSPAHVVANSMGGLIAVLAAARRPDLVWSLALISPAMPHVRQPSAARGLALLAVPKVGERLLSRLTNLAPDEQVRRLADTLFGDPDRIDPAGFELAVAERVRRMEQGYGDVVLLEALRSIVRYYAVPPWRSVWAAARRISCPALVVLGERDTLVGSSTAKRWRRSVPTVTVITLPSTGHVAMMERPTEVASLIRDWRGSH